MALANRYAGPRTGRRPSSKKKGSTRRGSAGGAKKGATRGTKRAGGPRSRKGWSGPAPAKQARGSNTTAPTKRQDKPTKEDVGKKGQTRSRAQASKPQGQRTAPDKRPTRKERPEDERVEEPGEGPQTYEITMDENLHGPEKMDAFKSKADEMVVGERTVIHNAAHYGIVRGMTWTVILSALLFWLPLVGPAVAGYVGGRKAGGPLRGVIAVIIPALVMFVLFSAVHESMDLLPTAMVSGVSFDAENIADLPARSIPLVAGLQQSIDAFMAAPPDVMFIMVVFAIAGGALSSLRRREEETVIEKVGIPLGELKERILKEQAEQAGTVYPEPPSRWHPHQAIAGTVAAHDSFNELVDEVAFKVYGYMVNGGQVPDTPDGKARSRRSKRRSRTAIQTGEEGPHYEDMVSVVQEPQAAVMPEPAPKARRGGRARTSKAGSNPAPLTAAEAIVGDAEDWEVVNTSKGRRPIRVVRSPPAAAEVAVREHDMMELEADVAPPPVVFEEEPSPADDLPEPTMYVEERGLGILGRAKHRVVYPTADQAVGLGAPASPHGDTGYEEPDQVPPARVHRNYERLPIVGSIYETMSREAPANVAVTESVRSMDEPTLEDTIEASTIASSAARELSEMARFEEGPDLVADEDEGPTEVRGRSRARGDLEVEEVDELAEAMEEVLPEEEDRTSHPKAGSHPKARRSKAKSTARQVRHPTGSLKSKGKAKGERDHQRVVYEDEEALVGVVEWNAEDDDSIEEEDLFNPRRLTDDTGDDSTPEDDGPEEGSEAWAEEERIAALVREREEWDRL
jgi:hypothetical protein